MREKPVNELLVINNPDEDGQTKTFLKLPCNAVALWRDFLERLGKKKN